MIEEIYIRDLGVIRDARLPLKPGLSVITGETGAGKTMVLSALGLLLGERADTGVVRQGQESAFVEGRWRVNPEAPVIARVHDSGADSEHGELILNRSISAEGRSRASVGGRAVPVGLLNELGEQLVVIHGQSDQIRLKSATAQRDALDQFAGPQLGSRLAAYRSDFGAWKAAASRLVDLRNSLMQRQSEAAELRSGVAELEAADVKPNEDVDLAETAARLTHLEELRQAAALAHEAISSESFEDSRDAVGLVGTAKRALENVAQHDSDLAKLAETAANLGFQLAELSGELSRYLAGLEANSAAELEVVQERRALITSLLRKYGPTLDELLAYQDKASNRLLELDSSTDEIDRLGSEVTALQESLIQQAAEITRLRTAAASKLADEVTGELRNLAMAGSSLVVSVTPAGELTTNGADEISIQLSAYPGAEPRPLGKGASGGELSRIMLAIEVVLAKDVQVPTFIFDEVDAGVGGAAAIEIGRRLAILAKTAQVIVVTHLAQVAAFANHHLRVLKTSNEGFTASDVVVVVAGNRVEELARMLSGLSDSAAAREHASELLNIAISEFGS